MRDPDGLARLLATQQDPASPDFRRWLTPAEFERALRRLGRGRRGARATGSTSHGLEVEDAPAGRTALVFSGRAADVESAFDTELHEVFADGAVRDRERAPGAASRRPRAPRRRRALAELVPAAHALARRVPAYTDAGGRHSLAPADFTAIYNVDRTRSRRGLNGSGRTIALLAQTNVNLADTTFFRQYFGLPANDPSVVLNGPDPGIVARTTTRERPRPPVGGRRRAGRAGLLVASKTTLDRLTASTSRRSTP